MNSGIEDDGGVKIDLPDMENKGEAEEEDAMQGSG